MVDSLSLGTGEVEFDECNEPSRSVEELPAVGISPALQVATGFKFLRYPYTSLSSSSKRQCFEFRPLDALWSTIFRYALVRLFNLLEQIFQSTFLHSGSPASLSSLAIVSQTRLALKSTDENFHLSFS